MLQKIILMMFVIGAALATGAQGAEVTGVDGQTVKVDAPRRIVAINSSVVETIYALGEGDRVVATDDSAVYPAAAEKLPKLGHPYRIGVEGVISMAPDLVIGTRDNLPDAMVRQLRGAGVPVLVLGASDQNGMEGLKQRVTAIATALAVEKAGDELIQRLDHDMAALAERVEELGGGSKGKRPKVLFLYTHGSGTAYAYGTKTGTETLLHLAGAVNAADFAEGRTAFNAEAIASTSPDAIVMLQRSLDAVGGIEGVRRIPGVSLTTAGRTGRIIAVDNSVRWVGPRFPEFARTLAEQLHSSQ